MRISKFNHEGYRDPTVYEALVNIEKERKEAQKLEPGRYRPLVYICSPYAGDVLNNERKARRYCQFAVRKKAIPLASHLLYPQILDDSDPGDRQLGLFFGTVLLGKCDECWVFGATISAGMAAEIAKAKKRGIPIRYFTEDMEEAQSGEDEKLAIDSAEGHSAGRGGAQVMNAVKGNTSVIRRSRYA